MSHLSQHVLRHLAVYFVTRGISGVLRRGARAAIRAAGRSRTRISSNSRALMVRPDTARDYRRATRCAKGGRKPNINKCMPGAGLSWLMCGKAPPDMPAFQPYRGKPAVRNDREGRGNDGIIRSPGSRLDSTRLRGAPSNGCPYRDRRDFGSAARRWRSRRRGCSISALAAPRWPVRTEKDVPVVNPANQGMRHDGSNPLNRARDRRILVMDWNQFEGMETV